MMIITFSFVIYVRKQTHYRVDGHSRINHVHFRVTRYLVLTEQCGPDFFVILEKTSIYGSSTLIYLIKLYIRLYFPIEEYIQLDTEIPKWHCI